MSNLQTTLISSEDHLAPSARRIGVFGGTGGGKTLLISRLTVPAASAVLARCVGETNSTICPRSITATSDPQFEACMIVAVRYKRDGFSTLDLMKLIADPLAGTVLNCSSGVEVTVVTQTFSENLSDAIRHCSNLRGHLALLDEDQIEEVIGQLVAWLSVCNFYEYLPEIFGQAKQTMIDRNEKPEKNNVKLLNAVRNQVEVWIDGLSVEQKQPLVDLCNQIVTMLEKYLEAVFANESGEISVSSDNYFFRKLPLEEQERSETDRAFINHFFTNNSQENGAPLSCELICNDIHIIVPIHKEFVGLLRGNKLFLDPHGHVTVSVLDVQGLYHAGSNDKETETYCSTLFYETEVSAIIALTPLIGDNNGRKTLACFRSILKGFRKRIPIFPVFTKADLKVDDLKKDLSDDFDESLSDADIDAALLLRSQQLFDDLLDGIRKPELLADPIPCYLRGRLSFPESLREKYSAIEAWKKVFDGLKVDGDRLPVHLEPEVTQLEVSIDSTKLEQVLRCAIASEYAKKKCFDPATANINQLRFLTPHGNSYNAMRNRLSYGYSYSCKIDESYFVNCHSFDADFPGNLRNLLSIDLIKELIGAISLKGGRFETENDYVTFLRLVSQYIAPNRFVAQVLRWNAIVDAERLPGSYGAYFRSFIRESAKYVSVPSEEAVAVFSKVLSDMLIEAARKTIVAEVSYR